MSTSDPNPAEAPETGDDLLKTAARAIGSTLGKIAVKTGIAKSPAPAPKKTIRKKTSAKKSPRKAVAAAKAKKAAPPGKKRPAKAKRS